MNWIAILMALPALVMAVISFINSIKAKQIAEEANTTAKATYEKVNSRYRD